MIRFTDVIKANKRYFYVLILSVAVCFGLIFGLTYHNNNYNARATIIVEKRPEVSGNEYITPEYAGTVISEVEMKATREDFSKKIIAQVAVKDQRLANNLSVDKIRDTLKINYQSGKTFFEMIVTYPEQEKAKEIADSAVAVICNEYNSQTGTKAQLTKVYSTEIYMDANKSVTYGIIGVLVGLVVAEIIITCIVAFNPYVDDEEFLQRQLGVDILATFEKVKGE